MFVCYAHGNQHQLLLETLSLLFFFFFSFSLIKNKVVAACLPHCGMFASLSLVLLESFLQL